MKNQFLIIVIAFLLFTSQIVAQKQKSEKKSIVITCHNCKPISEPKPEYPKAARAVNASGEVIVEVLIDEKGDVIKAKAVSGHPLLWAESVKTAYKTKYQPQTLSDKPVKMRGIIVYNFVADNLVPSKKEIENLMDNSTEKTKLGVTNGRATYLPKPNFSQEAKDFCADGKVEVEVLIDEKGSVVEAKAISGNELLQDSAVEAAKKAKFAPTPEMLVKTNGIVVYNFVSERKCINVGIVNKKALNLPKSQVGNIIHPKHLQIKELETVVVQISIDENGKVVYAKAASGHPLLYAACESSARQAKFYPTIVDGFPIIIKALLVYKFKPDGTIETAIEKDDKDVLKTPISLVEPPMVSCSCKFGGKNSSVIVTAEIDGQGNVVRATAVAGHPILKLACQKAALESKFLPTNIKTKMIIRYNFMEIDRWSVKISNIEITDVKIVQ